MHLSIMAMRDGTEKKIDLSMLCAPSADFRSSNTFKCDPEAGAVFFSPEALRDPRNIFSIFHEMGHLTDWQKLYIKNSSEAHRLLHVAEKKYEHFEHIAELLPFERNAWAEAIRIAKKIHQEHGVNFFEFFHSAEDFMGWLRAISLRGYEHALEKHDIRAYTKCWTVHAWALQEQKNPMLTKDDIEGIELWAKNPLRVV